MTLPSSGILKFSDLNVEFGRSSTTLISLTDAYAGTYAQYGDINRNTNAGQAIYYYYNVSPLNNFAISLFYDYNDTENVLWAYNFQNNGSVSNDVIVYYNSVQLYGNTINPGNPDQSGDVTTGTSSGASLGSIDLDLSTGSTTNFVDINCYDPDTLATIYSVTGDSPTNYSGGTIGSIYGYQRFVLDLTFYD
jgi:hypothetical protein